MDYSNNYSYGIYIGLYRIFKRALKEFLFLLLLASVIFSVDNTNNSHKIKLKDKNPIIQKQSISLDNKEKETSEEKEEGENKNITKDGQDNKDSNEEDDDEDANKLVEVTLETASDFIFRGNSFGGEVLSERDNTSYKSLNQAYAFQPTLDFYTPIKGFTVELWLNVFLSGRNDRDADGRILQSGPSRPELYPIFQNDLSNGKLTFDPQYIRPYREENGLKRDDGIELMPQYEFQNQKYGIFKTGIFSYNTFIPNDRFSWTQTYLIYEPKFLETLEPKVSIYKTVFNPDESKSTGINKGSAYASLELGHEFRKKQFYRISLNSSLGYIYQNNPVNEKSGLSDLTTKATLYAGKFFLTTNHVYRPDTKLYANNYYFDASTRYLNDGNANDPTKTYGYKNQVIFDSIAKASPNEVTRIYLKDKYEGHKVLQNIFYFSIGYTFEM
jgi:hypothetical protein